MKPTDVTLEIAERYQRYIVDRATHVGNDKEALQLIIAAAVNAFLGDPTPITAERLVACGYVKTGRDYYKKTEDCTVLGWCDGEVAIADIHGAVTLPTKTIGQLLALEIGLGIKPCP